MADWYGSARTNYFKVKDSEAFQAAMTKLDLQIWPNTQSAHNALGERTEVTVPDSFALGGESDKGGWPSSIYDEDTDDYIDVDIADLVASHLVDGEVAIFMECGAEKLRYITGNATAINSKGERRDIALSNIYDLAKELSDGDITEASY
jgi:hypothetical protein